MNRKCELYISNEKKNIFIYMDCENKLAFTRYFNQSERFKKKFRHIFSLILENMVNSELYQKLSNYDIWEIRVFPGQENGRIYCQEIISENKKHIILCELHQMKKSQKLKHIELNLIKKVKSYDYGFK